MKNILSLGLGKQSTALYLMSSIGELPRLDYAIFADLGREKKGTYEYLEWLLRWERENKGVPIVVVKKKNLYLDLLNQTNSTEQRFASIPAYTRSPDGTIGMLRRQCTSEYKILQVDAVIRYHVYESAARKRLPPTRIWKGISTDEWTRMNIPEEAWKTYVYPFINTITFKPGKARGEKFFEKTMSLTSVLQWYQQHNFPVPPKSACVFCPFQSERSWYDMQTKEPDDFEAACLVDEAIRDSSKKGSEQPIYLHESCVPLRQITFKADAPDLWTGNCSAECHN